MKELIGKTVKQLFVNEDQSFLKFVTGDADMIYYAEGDCCSESWFADILFGGWWRRCKLGKVVEVSDIEMPSIVDKMAEKDGRTRQEFDQVYGYVVKFEMGSLEIIYRNSSNGYYGGSCEYIKDTERHWYKEKLEDAVWTEITEDWSA